MYAFLYCASALKLLWNPHIFSEKMRQAAWNSMLPAMYICCFAPFLRSTQFFIHRNRQTAEHKNAELQQIILPDRIPQCRFGALEALPARGGRDA